MGIDVSKIKVGDNVVLRDGTTATVEEVNQYSNDFGLGLSCFPGSLLFVYASGWQKKHDQAKFDIVQHIPTQSIDVNKIKVGDTVTFRNGKTQTVQKIEPASVGLISSTTLRIVTDTQDGWFGMFGDTNGYRHSPQHPSDWDIIEHIPAEEDNMVDVSEIKVGDTIVSRDGTRMIVLYSRVEKGQHTNGFTTIKSEVIGHVGPGHGMVKRNHLGDGTYVSKILSNDDWADTTGFDIVEHIPSQGEEEHVEPAQDEMTMRDQFAVSALSGMLAKDRKTPLYGDLARWSYNIADEMMKARKENN